MRIPFVLCVLTAFVLAGCGSDEPGRSPAVEQLATLCDDAREEIEALGLPSEVGPELIPRWAAIGNDLAADVAAIEGATPAERANLRRMSALLSTYYRSLDEAIESYTKTKNAEEYAAAVERATASLVDAEAIAVQLGADECAKRPHADTPPPGY